MFDQSMNSYRRGLGNGVLVNPKLFIIEKVNFGPHIKCWSNLVKLSQTWSNVFKLVLFGTGRYIYSHIYLIYDKSEALECFKDHSRLVALQTNRGREITISLIPRVYK